MSASTPAPGWYPDPAGGGNRWWDGRSWTEHRSAAAVAIVQPPLPEGTTTGTPWIWLQAVLPVVQVLAQLPYILSFGSIYAAQLSLLRSSEASGLSDGAARAMLTQYTGLLGMLAVTAFFSLLTSAAWVVFAFLDARRLQRIGVVQPFHWAWSFLGIVYPIGRAVVVRRRVQGGLGPIWLLICTIVVSIVAVLVVEVAVLLPTLLAFVSFAQQAGEASQS